MKNSRLAKAVFLGLILLVVFVSMSSVDALAACDSLAASMDAARQTRDQAQASLDSLRKSETINNIGIFGKSFGGSEDGPGLSMDEFLSEGVGVANLAMQISEAEKKLAAAQKAYSEAHYNFMVCYQSHLQEEITGFCGHTYKRLHRSDHEWTYFDCGHKGYKCQPGIHYITYCAKCDKLYYFCEDEGHMYTCSGSGSQ